MKLRCGDMHFGTGFAVAARGQGAVIRVLGLVVAVMIPWSSAHGETLIDALKAAYENNPSLLAERARQRADDEAVPQALAGFRPTVTLNGSVLGQKVKTTPPPVTTKTDSSSYGISVSQPIFSGFRTINTTRKARAEVAAGQENLFDKEQSILLDVVIAYMDVRQARRISGLRQSNVRFLVKEVEVTSARSRAGELTETDTRQTKSRLYQGRALLDDAKANLAAAEARYEAVVGRRPGRLKAAPAVRHLLPKKLQEAIASGEGDSPLIAAATFRKEAAEHDLRVQKGELLPTVSLDGNYERTFDPSETTRREDDASLELRFSMPLYNAGTNFSKIRQGRAIVKQREHEIADIRREVKASVVTAWQQRLAAHRKMRNTHISVSEAEAALKGIKLEAAVGERAVFDVLDAQRDVINARVEQVNAERDFIVATYTLLASIGRLSAEGLELDTKIYDASANYKRVRLAPAWTASVKEN